MFGLNNLGLLLEFRLLVGIGRSGRLVAFILLQYHLSTPSWCRVMTKKPNKLTTKKQGLLTCGHDLGKKSRFQITLARPRLKRPHPQLAPPDSFPKRKKLKSIGFIISLPSDVSKTSVLSMSISKKL